MCFSGQSSYRRKYSSVVTSSITKNTPGQQMHIKTIKEKRLSIRSLGLSSIPASMPVLCWTKRAQLLIKLIVSRQINWHWNLLILAGSSQIHPLPSSNPISRQGSPYERLAESPQDNCIVQTTDWSECSAACGMGISSRITNDNQQCQLERQTRICMIRPCNSRQEKEIKVSLFCCG